MTNPTRKPKSTHTTSPADQLAALRQRIAEHEQRQLADYKALLAEEEALKAALSAEDSPVATSAPAPDDMVFMDVRLSEDSFYRAQTARDSLRLFRDITGVITQDNLTLSPNDLCSFLHLVEEPLSDSLDSGEWHTVRVPRPGA
ncbi:hypothetical protein [Marinimicrobium sp. ARAG 43.8]|uniref:hypothetical protein n=1 Tax=Marinimicrobium sp. ARAG 43.8 TaxID=3418719 RepID=UPI003CEC2000